MPVFWVTIAEIRTKYETVAITAETEEDALASAEELVDMGDIQFPGDEIYEFKATIEKGGRA